MREDARPESTSARYLLSPRCRNYPWPLLGMLSVFLVSKLDSRNGGEGLNAHHYTLSRTYALKVTAHPRDSCNMVEMINFWWRENTDAVLLAG